MSFFGSRIFGGSSGNGAIASSASSSISGAETIERLCDRVQSSSLLEDRRESLKTIKSLSKKYKLEVGTHAMPVLIDVLTNNRMDPELCCLALDTLFNIMTTENSNDQDEQQNLPADISAQFTEIFMKTKSNIELLFDLLDEFEFQTRWSTVKLLNTLIINQTQYLQDIILQIPRGVSRLMDLLTDSREIIRNDAIVLLINLTKTNASIQKIVAFESGFDRIMEIIHSEGSALDGGVVVEDCFNLLLNLLQMNYSNQSFFKEANYIKIICKFFDINDDTFKSNTSGNSDSNKEHGLQGGVWTLQKTTNLNLLLKLIRCLVAPNNQQQIINDCQKAYNHFGLLHRLCAMLMLPGVPADILSEAISTVAEVIRGNTANQQLFSTVMMQTNPPRPIIIILLMSMINEKQPFHLRCSILYCFQCYLFKNEEKKTEIVDTLLPKDHVHSSSSSQINTGQILCSGLFNQNDFVSNWLCAIALAHTINENNTLKEQLLRVQLAINTTSANNVQAVSLMQQCMNILIESSSSNSASSASASVQVASTKRLKFQTTISILMLMSTWLSNCPTAVYYFLSQQQNIPYLISQVSSTDTEEKSLIIQGLSSFLLGLSMLYNSNQVQAYTVDNLRDTIKKRIGIEQFEDKLEYISQHELYTKTLKKPTFAFKCKAATDLLFDYEFTRLFKSNETLILNLLTNKNQNVPRNDLQIESNESKSQLIEEHNTIISQYQHIIREQDAKLKEQYNLNQTLTQTCAQLQEHLAKLNDRYNELLNTYNYQATMNKEAPPSEETITEKLKMQARITELELKVNFLEEKTSVQEDEICKFQREKGILQETINNLQTIDKNTDLIEVRTQNNQLKQDYQNLQQEQENLLTLLQEMEDRLKKYKKIVKNYGEKVSESEDEAEEEDEDKENQEEIDNYNHNTDNQQPQNPSIITNGNLASQLDSLSTQFNNTVTLNNNPLPTAHNYFNEDNNSEHEHPDHNRINNNINLIIESNYMNNSSSSGGTDNSLHSDHTVSSSTTNSSGSSTGANNFYSLNPPPVGQNLNSLDLTTNKSLLFDSFNPNPNPNPTNPNNFFYPVAESFQQPPQQQLHNPLNNYFN